MTGWIRAPEFIPGTAGAYVLWLEFGRSVALPPRFGGHVEAGIYLYCGSARGGGGLRAGAHGIWRWTSPGAGTSIG